MMVVLMNWFSIGVALVPAVVAVNALAEETGEPKTVEIEVVAPHTGDETAGQVMVFVTANEAEDGQTRIIKRVARVDSTGEEGTGELGEVFVMAGSPSMVAGVPAAHAAILAEVEGSAWLGVFLAQVPEPVAAQLGLNGKGIMISNVAKDSPAEKGGLDRWDVIVAVNGEEIGNDLADVVKRLNQAGEGGKVELAVLRAGKEVKAQVTLAARPDMKGIVWKYPQAADMAVRHRIRDRVKALQRGPGGKWEITKLGDLDALHDLPPDVLRVLPHHDGVSTRIEIEDGHRSVHAQVERDGVEIDIEQEGDGPITVKRTQADGATTEDTYPDADALREADAEAADIFEGMHGSEFSLDIHGLDSFGGLEPLKNLTLRFEELGEHSEEVSEAMEEAREAFKEAMKDLPHQFRFHIDPHLSTTWSESYDEGDTGTGFWTDAGAERTFKTTADGAIEVRYTKDDSELIEIYESAADLRSRNPDLYQKYEEIRNLTH